MGNSDANGSGSARLFTRLGKPRAIGGPEEEPADIAILKEALADAIERAREYGSDTVWYLTNSPKDFRSQFHEEALGKETLDAMETEAGADMDGVAVKRAKAADLLARRLSGVILLVYPDPEMLRRVDLLSKPHGVIVVPWTDQPEAWNTKWGATPI